MPQRVTLDAMIPREDFAVTQEEFELELFRDFPINNLSSESPILRLLRKPDFQRETNHWTPEQICTFIASFLDNEVIPSLILWKSPKFIFVIDGGHRLSALRAWVEDDYGDGALSISFYKGEISDDQKKIAKRTRKIIESKIGRYSTLKSYIDAKMVDNQLLSKRANRLFTRPLTLQWIQGNSEVAETSFFKINSQGTPLDDTEEMLIKNRRKPIAIAARAILRSGTGHQYWSAFAPQLKERVENLAAEFYEILFEPESKAPIKTLDVPYGGTVSPVDALSLLIDFLTISSSRLALPLQIDKYENDETGGKTVEILSKSLEVLNRITGNSGASLGLHPAVYFYNERGKYNRFLFLGMIALLTEKIRNNDDYFFKSFTRARQKLEEFLVENKSTITLTLQNMSKTQRIPKIKSLFAYVVDTASKKDGPPSMQSALEHIGLQGRVLDLTEQKPGTIFTDEVKSKLFVDTALQSALKCPICGGYLHTVKSVSYDHIKPKRDGGTGIQGNGQLVHPYCNTGYKS